jgi:hypothetical protein
MRQLMGLDAAETVSATFEDLREASDPQFLETLTRILDAFPNHFHVFVGPGDVKYVRAHLHAEGVLPAGAVHGLDLGCGVRHGRE